MRTFCSVCLEPQFETRSGPVCKNGHGGAPSIEQDSVRIELPDKSESFAILQLELSGRISPPSGDAALDALCAEIRQLRQRALPSGDAVLDAPCAEIRQLRQQARIAKENNEY